MLGRDRKRIGYVAAGIALIFSAFLAVEKATDLGQESHSERADSLTQGVDRTFSIEGAEIGDSEQVFERRYTEESKYVIRQRKENLTDLVVRAADEFEFKGSSESLVIPTFDGERLTIRIENLQRPDSRKGVISGRIEKDPFSLAVLSWVGDAVSGSLHVPAKRKVYEIRYAGGGESYISEINTSNLGGCETDAALATRQSAKSNEKVAL